MFKQTSLRRSAVVTPLFLFFASFQNCVATAAESPVTLIQAASELLDNSGISYAYGGKRIGTKEECDRCNRCIEQKKVDKGLLRLTACPSCSSCSLDCSHFVQLVFRLADLPFTFLTTSTMLSASPQLLREKYHLIDIAIDPTQFSPGDLLVYQGHVVLLEKIHAEGRGDIVHATSGRDLRGPGVGIQRERMVDLLSYRGLLFRVLRHVALNTSP